jgi:hypothetical protein
VSSAGGIGVSTGTGPFGGTASVGVSAGVAIGVSVGTGASVGDPVGDAPALTSTMLTNVEARVIGRRGPGKSSLRGRCQRSIDSVAFRFFFWSNERNEPLHIHVESGDGYAKFWLSQVSLAESGGYDGGELRQLLEIVRKRRERMERAWYDHFGT